MRDIPSAIAVSSPYRWEIYLSPGKRMTPRSRRAGEMETSMRGFHYCSGHLAVGRSATHVGCASRRSFDSYAIAATAF
jgi:hypothetical protein